MEGKPLDLTEHRLKLKFLESVNDQIRFYNQGHYSFHEYYQNALSSHQTTAMHLGWTDIAVAICDQCNEIYKKAKPQIISI